MQKQGPPAVLNDAHFAKLQARKSGQPAPAPSGRKRAAAEEINELPAKRKSILKKPSNGLIPGRNGAINGKGVNGRVEKTKRAPYSNGRPPKSGIQNGKLKNGGGAERVKMGAEPLMSGALGSSDEEQPNDDPEFSGSSVYDSDEELRKGIFSEDEESDAEEKLTAANIEGLSRTLDAEQEADAEAAALELKETGLQTNIDGERPKVLEDESDKDESRVRTKLRHAPDLQLLRTRIVETVRVLDDFSRLAEEGRSRAEYTAQLLKDICGYYDYSPLLAEKLFNLFTPREAFEFFEANETPRPVVLRTNTLKTHRRELAQALINRGVTLEPVGKWSKIGLQVFESQVPLGATPEYLAGHYILQAASSFLPVMALGPQEHERVLDMAAAPGGKTTHMAALMKNTGCIFANDSNKARAKALIGNIHRSGARNTIVCNYDARQFPKVIGGFDRVLLDAPCSGTGVIAKDPSVKTNKTQRDFLALPHLQKQLLLAAIDSVDHASKTGAVVVYSTCSVTIEENEMVVQYVLSRRPNIQIEDSGLPFGVDGFVSYMGKKFDPRMKLAKRYYPHTYNVDGFFVCKLRKTGPTPKNLGLAKDRSIPDEVVASEGDPSTDGEQDTNSDFGGWDEDEDAAYMERARRKMLKKKGKDPKADVRRKSNNLE